MPYCERCKIKETSFIMSYDINIFGQEMKSATLYFCDDCKDLLCEILIKQKKNFSVASI